MYCIVGFADRSQAAELRNNSTKAKRNKEKKQFILRPLSFDNAELKRTISRHFLLQAFFMNHLPQPPENNIRV
jgi:hypothetical protein